MCARVIVLGAWGPQSSDLYIHTGSLTKKRYICAIIGRLRSTGSRPKRSCVAIGGGVGGGGGLWTTSGTCIVCNMGYHVKCDVFVSPLAGGRSNLDVSAHCVRIGPTRCSVLHPCAILDSRVQNVRRYTHYLSTSKPFGTFWCTILKPFYG